MMWHDRMVALNAGPAKNDAGMTSAPASMMSRLGDSRPKLMIPTKRKLVDETVPVTATAADAASAVVELATKSSVKSRLGDPVTGDGQRGLMISTKRKQVDETVSATAAGGLQSRLGKLSTSLSVKSRLGEQVTTESQSRVMISTRSKFAAVAGGDDEQLGYVPSAKYKTVFGRLGPSAI